MVPERSLDELIPDDDPGDEPDDVEEEEEVPLEVLPDRLPPTAAASETPDFSSASAAAMRSGERQL